MRARAIVDSVAVVSLSLALAGAALAQDKKAGAPAVEDKKPTPLALGAKAPLSDRKMKSVDGSEASIAGVAGKKGTLVVFTCNACPYVKAWEGRIAEIGKAFLGKGIGVLWINSNDPGRVPEDGFEQMQERAKDLELAFPYVVDATSEVARAFGATRTPEAFLFDGDGRLVYHGTIDDNYKDPEQVKATYLRDAVDAVASGKPVAVAETKALGCSIKFRS